MAAVLSRWWQWVHRTVNRSEWVVRLLRLPRSTGTATGPGLVIVQVDGLSLGQCERALARGRMPFVRWLMRRQGHRMHTMYSGVPSTTAAFQGELFYGVPGGVPAYSFFHREMKCRLHMVDAPAAQKVQEELAAKGEGLLKDGVAYCGFYDGGAAESHFGPKSLSPLELLRLMPFALLWLAALHAFAVLRVLALLVVEVFLALFDAFRGWLTGHGLSFELGYVFHRVALTVLLRELCVIGAKADVERGVPIVYVDFIGYDEQSHHRGPGSRFAHWTLKGIDDSIKRIWRAAQASPARDYEVWILSDHGHEHTRPYQEATGSSIADQLQEIVADLGDRVRGKEDRGPGNDRAQWMGIASSGVTRWLSSRPPEVPVGEDATWTLCANGPVGHCYAPLELSVQELDLVARELVARAAVPAVLRRDGPGRAVAHTAAGSFPLPERVDVLIGPDHEFADSMANDLVALVHHANAGELVLFSQGHGSPGISFAHEHGAHGGIGPEETRAFAVLPPDALFPRTGRAYLRAGDLYRAARRFLGREGRVEDVSRQARRADGTLRVMSSDPEARKADYIFLRLRRRVTSSAGISAP